jgi:hypothetical protein
MQRYGLLKSSVIVLFFCQDIAEGFALEVVLSLQYKSARGSKMKAKY